MKKENVEIVIHAINDINKNNVDLPSLNHNIEKIDKEIGFEEVFNKILKYISNKDIEKLDNIVTRIENISSRTKTKASIKKKWDKNLAKKRPIKKVFNDIVGIRIVTNNIDSIIKDIKQIAEINNYIIEIIDFNNNPKSIDDGYRGTHIYFKTNPKSFRIEVQIWSIIDAIINFYTHQYIYKNNGNYTYSLHLREWIENIPINDKFNFINYIWEVINNPSIYAYEVSELLIYSMENNGTQEDVLLKHYMKLTKLKENDDYAVRLKEHLNKVPNNYEGIEITFIEYIIRRIIEEVV